MKNSSEIFAKYAAIVDAEDKKIAADRLHRAKDIAAAAVASNELSKDIKRAVVEFFLRDGPSEFCICPGEGCPGHG
jgi:hypothetical protein